MSEGGALTLPLHMHSALYGFQIGDQPSQPSFAPEQQWSTGGWQQRMETLRSSLGFSVSMDGWTRTNRVQPDFYNKFENELVKS